MTRIPLEIGYRHVGPPYYISGSRKITFNPSTLRVWWDRFRAEAKYLATEAPKLGNVAVRSLADHAPINYVWAVKACEPWIITQTKS